MIPYPKQQAIETALRYRAAHMSPDDTDKEFYKLTPVYHDVFGVADELHQYDPNMFIVFNNETCRFEVHSLQHVPNTYATMVPYFKLDRRTVRHVWRNDLRIHGEEIFKRIERSEEFEEKRKERERKNWIEDVGKETQAMFAKDAWTFAT